MGIASATGLPEHPVRKIIKEALARAGADYATRANHPPGAKKHLSRHARATVVGLALSHVIRQRTVGQCTDKNLAYADHYLQARLHAAYLGEPEYHLVPAQVVAYKLTKKIWRELGISAPDSQFPEPIAPDTNSVAWALKGAEDGSGDYMDGAADLKEHAISYRARAIAEGTRSMWERAFRRRSRR